MDYNGVVKLSQLISETSVSNRSFALMLTTNRTTASADVDKTT